MLHETQEDKSARAIAGMLNVRPGTVTKRLRNAGYTYYRDKWIPENEKPQVKPMSDEE